MVRRTFFRGTISPIGTSFSVMLSRSSVPGNSYYIAGTSCRFTTATRCNTTMNKNKDKLNITVIGGGNSTPIFAVLSKLADHHVSVLTRRPQDWSRTVGFVNQDPEYLEGKKEFSAEIDLITSDASKCIPQADMIFIAGVPVHHNAKLLRELVAPHFNRDGNVMIGTICAYGAFNWIAADSLGRGNYILFGTQLIPWFCGTLAYGRLAVVFGAKRMLRAATEDGKDTFGVKKILNNILHIPDMRDTDFLASSFWPNNASLHPPVLYGVFSDFDGETPYDENGLPKKIYAELTEGGYDALCKLDDELVAIVKALSKHYPKNEHLKENFRLQHCILENYKDQVKDPSTLFTTVTTNKAFGSHCIPYTQVEEGKVIPTLQHKFFESDLPLGLCLFKDVALMAGVDTPMMDALIRWNQKLIHKEYLTESGRVDGKDSAECVLPSRYGLTIDALDRGRRGQKCKL